MANQTIVAALHALAARCPDGYQTLIQDGGIAKIGDIPERSEAKKLCDKLAKDLRSDGWQMWTGPASHMGLGWE